MLAVELQFLSDDTEWFLGYFTLDSPVKDVIRNLGNVCWKFFCWNNLLYFREWGFVVGPVEDVLFSCLFFGERIVFLCYSFIVSEWTQR